MFQLHHLKTMVIAVSHMLHVQNVYLIHIIQRFWLRHPIGVIALCSISLTYYKNHCGVSIVTKRSQFTIPKLNILCFMPLRKTLHRYCLVHVQPKKTSWLNYCWLWRRAMTLGIKHIAMFQAFVAEIFVSRVTTSVTAGIPEPFEQPTFCFDKD